MLHSYFRFAPPPYPRDKTISDNSPPGPKGWTCPGGCPGGMVTGKTEPCITPSALELTVNIALENRSLIRTTVLLKFGKVGKNLVETKIGVIIQHFNIFSKLVSKSRLGAQSVCVLMLSDE